MLHIDEPFKKFMDIAFAEALKRVTEASEIRSQLNSTSLFLPNFAVYEKARQKGQLAFFKVMGVKCRPLNPAESVRHKGKLAILSKTHDKEEALAVSKRVHEALRRGRGARFTNGVRVQ